jgi:ADP-ribose pyrophosphatase
MHSPKIGKRKRVYQNRYHEIYRVKADFGDFKKEYFVSDYGERVGLIIAKGDEVLLVSQYRLLIDGASWEIPGGRVDKDESPRKAATREAMEEAGLVCRGLKPLLYFHPGLDTFHNPTHVFYATEFVEAPPGSVHRNEVSGRRWIPLAKCLKMIFARQIKDSLSITSLLAFHAATTGRNRRAGARGA